MTVDAAAAPAAVVATVGVHRGAGRLSRRRVRLPGRTVAPAGPPGSSGSGRGSGRGDGDGGGGDHRAAWMLLPAFAAAGGDEVAQKKLRIVATTTIIHDLTRQLAAENVELHGLIKPGDDPHVYEPVPADSVLIEKADVILFNGYDLESNVMPLIRSTSSKTRRYPVGECVVPLTAVDSGPNTPDPHVWNDARNAASMVNAIADALVECDPAHTKEYRARAKRISRELHELDAWIKKSIQSIPAPQRLLVTTHDAFQYYGRAYGLHIPGTLLGINTEEQPSARVMLELIQEIRRVKPRAVFFEQTVSPILIRAVAEDAQVKLCDESLYSDSIGPKGSGAETYSEMMAYNTRVIVNALGGKMAPAPLAFANRR
ncbi:Manganese-binding lipoprotein MntA [Porphyridium purpureum]|uniref:Manganese-binding lipoprotein MntA n=1 Tax=Porphyridium purpureum TaxID=35688 RepID=A0A5J4YS43_PORPP|nr:Manganese-binding lipoprotein MntA [Porphyridium purpureum]|eukprot:POR0229..scf296_7